MRLPSADGRILRLEKTANPFPRNINAQNPSLFFNIPSHRHRPASRFELGSHAKNGGGLVAVHNPKKALKGKTTPHAKKPAKPVFIGLRGLFQGF
jgi:hypothetical protein